MILTGSGQPGKQSYHSTVSFFTSFFSCSEFSSPLFLQTKKNQSWRIFSDEIYPTHKETLFRLFENKNMKRITTYHFVVWYFKFFLRIRSKKNVAYPVEENSWTILDKEMISSFDELRAFNNNNIARHIHPSLPPTVHRKSLICLLFCELKRCIKVLPNRTSMISNNCNLTEKKFINGN